MFIKLSGRRTVLCSSIGVIIALSKMLERESCCEAYTASKGIIAYGATYAANNPSEDRMVVSPVGLGRGKSATMVGVFDGHGGWQVSEFVSENIVDVLTRHLSALQGRDDEVSVSDALRAAYAELEARYLHGVQKSFEYGFGAVAKVGCCALVVVRVGDRLNIANTGDCRAVLGSTIADSAGLDTMKAVRLTRDHNAREPLEVLRLQAEHPGEPLSSLIRCKNPHACYVKGRLQLTRALGDAYLKYPHFNAPPGSHRDRGRHIAPPYTPPYVGAVPQVNHITLTPTRDKFVVVASDGVWDYLSDQDAVDVVAEATQKGTCPAEAIKLAALKVAAKECGMTLEQLLDFPPGKQRRGRHDDTTAVVLNLE